MTIPPWSRNENSLREPRIFDILSESEASSSSPRRNHDLDSTLIDGYIAIVWPTSSRFLFNPLPSREDFDSDSDTLPTTLSSWRRNMDRLSALIDRLSELAATAVLEHRRQLILQVAALRKNFRKQQERYVTFLRLTKTYSDRFLADISEEIQQQSSFLDALERRLDMAKNLREQAVHLLKSHEVGTLKSIMKVRHTGAYSCISVMYLFETCLQSYPNHFRKMWTYSMRWTSS